MGIKKGHSLTNILKNLNIGQLVTAATTLLNKKQQSKVTDRVAPVIDIDASWIVRRLSASSEQSRVGYLFRLARTLQNVGFVVYIICDGEVRHPSKRSTILRKSKLYKNQ